MMQSATKLFMVSLTAAMLFASCHCSLAKDAVAKTKVEHKDISNPHLTFPKATYSSIVLDPPMLKRFPKAFTRDRKLFEERMDVTMPVTLVGNFYFGTSCKVHECNTTDAAWTIDKATGKGIAILSQTEQMPGSGDRHTFRLYGVNAIADLPPPLLQWGQKEGMTATNASIEK